MVAGPTLALNASSCPARFAVSEWAMNTSSNATIPTPREAAAVVVPRLLGLRRLSPKAANTDGLPSVPASYPSVPVLACSWTLIYQRWRS
jgi:hypothetical protein